MLLFTTRKAGRASARFNVLNRAVFASGISYKRIGVVVLHPFDKSPELPATGVAGGSTTCLNIASNTGPADFARSPLKPSRMAAQACCDGDR